MMKRFVNGIMEDPIWQKRVPQKVPDWLQTATVSVPLRPDGGGARRQRRGAPGVGGQPRRDRLQPVAVPARRPRPPRRAARGPGPRAGGQLGRRAARRAGRPRGARRARAARLSEDVGLQGHPRATCGSTPDWDFLEVRRAALALAREIERRAPDLATAKWWKEERHGVFVDYNQNARDRTVASGYCVRPTPDARVSCALEWSEVADVEPGDLRLDTVPVAAGLGRRPGGGRSTTCPGRWTRCWTSPGATRRAGSATRRGRRTSRRRRGEPKRVQPSRDADRPVRRGRAGDPQPGGPPPGFSSQSQRGFGSKPRTGQGHESEFDGEESPLRGPGRRQARARRRADPCVRPFRNARVTL